MNEVVFAFFEVEELQPWVFHEEIVPLVGDNAFDKLSLEVVKSIFEVVSDEISERVVFEALKSLWLASLDDLLWGEFPFGVLPFDFFVEFFWRLVDIWHVVGSWGTDECWGADEC